jgi:hypothetical protein
MPVLRIDVGIATVTISRRYDYRIHWKFDILECC